MVKLFDLVELTNYIVTDESPFIKIDKALFKGIAECYDPCSIKYFYPKNIFKDEKVEYLIFCKDGYSIVSSKEGITNHFTTNARLISKQLTKPRTQYRNHILTLNYDNGETLKLESNVDSEPEWHTEYGKQLIEMYKYL